MTESVMASEDWELAQAALNEQFEAEYPFRQATMRVQSPVLDNVHLKVLVAESAEQRTRGMMGRRFAGFDAMLFVFPTEDTVRFHNRGVGMPIVIAFYAADGECVDVQVMGLDAEVTSEAPAKYALELPLADHVCTCDNYTGSENGRCERCGGSLAAALVAMLDVLSAQGGEPKRKLSAEEANLRPAEPASPDSCPNCTFYLGNGICEIVEKAGPGLVSNEFTPMEVGDGTYPSRSWPISPVPSRTP